MMRRHHQLDTDAVYLRWRARGTTLEKNGIYNTKNKPRKNGVV
jgi:hypothetical protein